MARRRGQLVQHAAPPLVCVPTDENVLKAEAIRKLSDSLDLAHTTLTNLSEAARKVKEAPMLMAATTGLLVRRTHLSHRDVEAVLDALAKLPEILSEMGYVE